MIRSNSISAGANKGIALSRSLLLAVCCFSLVSAPAGALGVLTAPAVRVHIPAHPRVYPTSIFLKGKTVNPRSILPSRSARLRKTHATAKTETRAAVKPKKPVVVSRALQPQLYSDKMTTQELAPGVVHRYFRGPLSINLLDIDMTRAPVKVQPYLAGNSFKALKDVAQHAREAHAMAAINANYFKRDGVPLGTLIIDGEWVSGPLYDRVSMGITNDGTVRIDRVSFGGNLTSDNPDLENTWVNNINQPRRSGCHVFAYTRRWGQSIKLPYEGTMVAIDAQGKVQDSTTTAEMQIPFGGYVLTDAKDAPISKLQRGDSVKIDWQTKPYWNDVVEAVSGGPMLIKDGKLFLDLKDENFRRAWTGSQIKARTVAGVTADKHLLLATIEGPHTLWDVAKFLLKMGAVDAMNLDGGGSTTMVVNGKTVTRNANSSQRRVVSSIVVVDTRIPSSSNLTSFKEAGSHGQSAAAINLPLMPATDAPDSGNTANILLQPVHPLNSHTVQTIEGIASPPAQPVDVRPTSTASSDEESRHPKKKKHFFGLLGGR